MKLRLALLGLLVVAAAAPVAADPPKTISHQGLLRYADGSFVPDDDYDITFRLYHEEQGGTAFWSETHVAVPVRTGVFNVILGKDTPLGIAHFEEPCWLGLTIQGNPSELAPRVELTSSPYAFFAEEARSAPPPLPFQGTVCSTSPGIGIENSCGMAIRGLATQTGSVINYGGYFEAYGDQGRAVGAATNGIDAKSIFALALGEDGIGVYGEATGANGWGLYTPSDAYVGEMLKVMGDVGIGTTDPAARLHVVHEDPHSIPSMILSNTYATGHARISFEVDATEQGYIFFNRNGATVYNTQGGGMYFRSNGDTKMIIVDSGNVGIGTDSPTERLEVDGRVKCNSLEITGTGADVAEPFGVTGSDAAKPGMVLVIDPMAPGKLKVCSTEYDRRVAGIVSGAGGISPGVVMGRLQVDTDGEHPVALSGRVYCWADASYGSINPGDLLTTSATLGHAMKASDQGRAQGAIIGKAMNSLESGKGLVLVLVTLQ